MAEEQPPYAIWIGDPRQFEGFEHIWHPIKDWPRTLRAVDDQVSRLEYRAVPGVNPPRRFISREVMQKLDRFHSTGCLASNPAHLEE